MPPSGFSYVPLIMCKRNLRTCTLCFSNFAFISAFHYSVVYRQLVESGSIILNTTDCVCSNEYHVDEKK